MAGPGGATGRPEEEPRCGGAKSAPRCSRALFRPIDDRHIGPVERDHRREILAIARHEWHSLRRGPGETAARERQDGVGCGRDVDVFSVVSPEDGNDLGLEASTAPLRVVSDSLSDPRRETNGPRDDRLGGWQSFSLGGRTWEGLRRAHHPIDTSLVCSRKTSPRAGNGRAPSVAGPARVASHPKNETRRDTGTTLCLVSERPPRPRYDTHELRLRMAVGLSAASLREVSARLGAPPATGTTDTLARELVRFAEKADRVPELVAALAAEAPLVEWPAPLDESPAPEVHAPEPIVAAPTIPEPAPEAPEAAPPEAALAPAPPSAWIPPGRGAPAPAAKAGLDPRLLVAVAGFMALAALFAFLAGRITAGTGDEEPAPRAQAAQHAANALQASLGNVARTCKVSADPPLEASLLRTAYDVCGVSAERARPHALPSLDEVPSAKPSEPAGPLVPPPTRSELPRATTACVDQCNGTHNGCRRGCGAEPTDASAYTDYQACLGKCLKASSQCRQACAAP